MTNEKEKSFISAVVYIHNNGNIIKYFLDTIINWFPSEFENYEFIFVNDSSTDDSENIISEYIKHHDEHPEARGTFSIINMGRFQGVEASIQAGVDLSVGDFILEFDTVEIDYHVSLIKEIFIKALEEGNDIVLASPENTRRSKKIAYGLFNSFSNLYLPLAPKTFSVISRRAVNRVNAMSVLIPYRKALYAICNLSMAYVTYENCKVVKKRSILSQKERLNTIIDAVLLFTSFAFKISSFFAIAMSFFMLAAGIYVAVVYFQTKPVAGWAPLMGLVSAGFFGIFITFSIIIKYLDLLLKMVFKRQNYLVASVAKLRNRK